MTIYITDDKKVEIWIGNIINEQYTYVYIFPGNLTENNYNANITTKANNDYASTSRTVNITLNNRRTYISSTNKVAYIDSTITLNGTITDPHKKTGTDKRGNNNKYRWNTTGNRNAKNRPSSTR